MLINKTFRWRDANALYKPDGSGTGTPAVPGTTPTTTPVTPSVTSPPATDAPADNSSDTEEPYDRDRAMATIQNLRKFEREAKAAQKRLAELEAAEQARAQADLSETEQAKQRAEAAEKKLLEVEQRHQQTLIRSAVEMAATRLKFHDASDAYRLADLTAVVVDDQGAVTGVNEALKALASTKPHLLMADTPTAPNINSGRPGTPPPLTPEAIVEQKRQSGQYVPF